MSGGLSFDSSSALYNDLLECSMELKMCIMTRALVTLLQILMNARREHQIVQKDVPTLLAVTPVDAMKATVWHQMEFHARVSGIRTEKIENDEGCCREQRLL